MIRDIRPYLERKNIRVAGIGKLKQGAADRAGLAREGFWADRGFAN